MKVLSMNVQAESSMMTWVAPLRMARIAKSRNGWETLKVPRPITRTCAVCPDVATRILASGMARHPPQAVSRQRDEFW
jgi:hypothetical protein